MIQGVRGRPAKVPAKLESKGTLQTSITTWPPIDEPFQAYIEDSRGRRLSEKTQFAPLRAEVEKPKPVPEPTLPVGFPEDVPIYPGVKIEISNNRSGRMSVVFRTTDTSDKVALFYVEKLKANGWSPRTTIDNKEMTGIDGAKKGQSLTVVLTEGKDASTEVSLIVTRERRLN